MLNLFNVVQFAHARQSQTSLDLLSLNRKFQDDVIVSDERGTYNDERKSSGRREYE